RRSERCLGAGVRIGSSRPAPARSIQFSQAASSGASAASPSGSRGSCESAVFLITRPVSGLGRGWRAPGRLLSILLALGLGVDLGADQDGQAGQVEPEDQDGYPGERAVRLAVGAEI